MLSPGIYDITADEYHADPSSEPSFTSSICKVLYSSSALHAWTEHPRLNPSFVREEKEIFDLGQVTHALILQGIDTAHIIQAKTKEGAQVSDWRTKAAKEERDLVRSEKKIPVLAHQWDRIKAMVDAAKAQIGAHKEASGAFTNGKPEQTLVWLDRASDGTPVHCRARLDWLNTDYRRILDYKGTGTSVNPESIAKYAVSSGWDIQASLYLRGLKIITGIEAEFLFVAQEDFEPYALTICGMGPDFLWAGDAKVQESMDKWAACLKNGLWPGYSDRIVYPALPSYEETRITERQLRNA